MPTATGSPTSPQVQTTITNHPRLLPVAACAALLAAPTLGQGILFSDSFDTDTTTNWTVREGSVSGTPDFGAVFNYDYSQKGIPAAPNSTGDTTHGVWLTVNKDDTADQAAVSIFPTGQSFSSNYALRFDMWLGYGGTGSTEFATFGLNHSDDFAQWSLSADSDSGLFFAVTGEGGAARDWRAYLGSPGGAPLELQAAAGGLLDCDRSGWVEDEAFNLNSATNPLRFMFPEPSFGTPEVPGKRWVQGEVRQQDGKVTWSLNGYVIAQRDLDALAASGNQCGPHHVRHHRARARSTATTSAAPRPIRPPRPSARPPSLPSSAPRPSWLPAQFSAIGLPAKSPRLTGA